MNYKVRSVYDNHIYSISSGKKVAHTEPLPSSEYLSELYNKSYGYEAHKLIRPEKRIRAYYLSKYIKEVEQSVNRVAEIGPMFGDFLLRNCKGSEKIAIEFNEHMREYYESKGTQFIGGDAEKSISIIDNQLDLFVLSHSLEHFRNPKNLLELINNKLNQNGYILVSVPNLNSYIRKVSGRHWGYWAVPVHLYHFSQDTLVALLESANFKVKKVGFIGGDSFMFLSTIASMMGLSLGQSQKKNFPFLTRVIIKSFSILMLPWILLGNDDLIILAQKKGE